MKSLEEAKKYFFNDRFAVSTTGIQIEAVDDNYAKCSLKIEERHLNAADRLMGGAIFTLADFTFAVATNSPDCRIVTTNSTITYLGTAKGSTLYSESKVIKTGKSICTLEISVTDNLDNKIALVVTSGMRV